jgi:NAD(P)-dependent dehydrogenase (short-subunit alcohol dehydrogenase family)
VEPAGATALVTGGSKGMGHAVVEELAGFGAQVHTCSRSAADLEECRRRWAEKGLSVTVSFCDVAAHADRERLVDTVKATFDGELDILVNNAGLLFFKPAMECTVHGEGLRADDGDQPGVVLPPQPARAPAAPQRLPRRRRKRHSRLLHRQLRRLPIGS